MGSAAGGDASAAGEAPPALEAPPFEIRNAFGDRSPDMGGFGGMDGGDRLLLDAGENDAFLDALRERRDNGVRQKLRRIVEFDEEHAARILKQWIKQGAGA